MGKNLMVEKSSKLRLLYFPLISFLLLATFSLVCTFLARGENPVYGEAAVTRWMSRNTPTFIDFFAENALEHERTGEMIERIGIVNFLEGIGVDVDPNMVANPRESSYVMTDEWDQEAVKWYERADNKKESA